MYKKMVIGLLSVLLAAPLFTGCSRDFLGGAAIGAAGAGAAYEYQNKRQMDMLEDDLRAGRISREEYFQRKKKIENGSLIY